MTHARPQIVWHPLDPAQAPEPRLSRSRARPEAIFPVAPPAAALPETYAATLQEIKTHLRSARLRAVLAANPIVIEAYWHMGKIILARQQEAAWGAKVIDRLAADLQEAFPDMGGLTRRNLFFMRAFAESFPDGPIVKQPVSQLPWSQIIRLIQMVKDPAARDFYIRETLAAFASSPNATPPRIRQLVNEVAALVAKVDVHLKKMGAKL